MDVKRTRQILILFTLLFDGFWVRATEPGRSASPSELSETGDESDWSEPEPDEYIYETEVVGDRLHATDEVTGHAETIRIDDRHKSVQSVSEVVSEATGVEVRRTGGAGSFGAVSIRGSTPHQVPVFLDGMLLNAGGFSVVNLGDFSLDILDRIEVYRGNTPLRLGMGGIGGAVVLTTREPSEPITQITGSVGSFHTWRLATLRHDRVGPAGVLVMFSADGSRGDFPYYNTNGTPNAAADDSWSRRTNNAHVAYNGLIKLDARKGAWHTQFTDDLFFIRQGVPGIDSYVNVSSAELRRMRNSAGFKASRFIGNRGEAVYELFNLVLQEEFRDPERTIGIGHRTTMYESLGLGGSALLTGRVASRHRLTSRAAFLFENYRQHKPGIPADEQPNPIYRLKPQLGLEYEWNIPSNLFVVPTVRGELHYSHFDGGPIPELLGDFETTTTTRYYISPSLGLRYLVNGVLTLRANGGRYVRAPELTELFGDHGFIVGNPKLEEEVGYNLDAGFSATWTQQKWLHLLRLDGAFFAGWTRDLISLEQNSQNTARPTNIENAQMHGFEFALRMSILGNLVVQGNYTYFYGINRSDIPHYSGKQLPGRSPHQVYGRVEIKEEWERIGLMGFYDIDYASKTFTGQYNAPAHVAMHLFHGIGGRVEYRPQGLSFTLEINNLTDNRTFRNHDGNTLPMSDYLRYPLPGRAIFGTLHWDFPYDKE